MGVLYQVTKNVALPRLRGLRPTNVEELLDKVKRLRDDGDTVTHVDVIPQVVERHYEDSAYGTFPRTVDYFLNFRAHLTHLNGSRDITVRERASGVWLPSYDFVNIAETEAKLMRRAQDAALQIAKAGFNSRVEEEWERPYQRSFLERLAGTALGQEGMRVALERYRRALGE